jgi:hypothetical protein
MYGPTRIPKVITDVLGFQLAGPCLCLKVDMSAADLTTLCIRLQLGTASDKDHIKMNELRREARELRHQVLTAYKRVANGNR